VSTALDRAPKRILGDAHSSVKQRAACFGQVIAGTYRLQECVGAGGTGAVYAAEHLRLGRTFALKLLHANHQPKALERFRREAEALARIESEFVVGVVDCGETEAGAPYLVMDFLRGEDLRSLLERAAPLPIPRAVNLVWEACQGVAAVHRAGLIHRDLKPENLFVTRRASGADLCKVLDFGIAKSEISTSTAEGAVIGTVSYMAPEQLLDGASVGPSVDLYSLGAVLYECLGGVPPHTGTSVQELMFKVINERPLHLEQRRSEIPLALADAVQRALGKSPNGRFRDVLEFARAIAPFTRGLALSGQNPQSETVELEPAVRGALQSTRIRSTLTVVVLATAGALGFAARGFSMKRPSLVASLNAPLAASGAPTHSLPTPTALQAVAAPAPAPSSPSGTSEVPSTPASARLVVADPKRQPPPAHSRAPSPRHAAGLAPPWAGFDSENPYGP
jgi:serine/threonine protein kinase